MSDKYSVTARIVPQMPPSYAARVREDQHRQMVAKLAELLREGEIYTVRIKSEEYQVPDVYGGYTTEVTLSFELGIAERMKMKLGYAPLFTYPELLRTPEAFWKTAWEAVRHSVATWFRKGAY